MKFLKILGAVILLPLCLAAILWSGYFLWRAIPGEPSAPQMLSSEAVELASREEDSAAAEAAPEVAPEEIPEEIPEEVPEELPEEVPEELPEVIPEETEPAEDYAEEAAAYLQTMTLEEKLWQLFIVTPEALSGETATATEATLTALTEKPVGGVVYFSDNLQDWNQTAEMLAATQSYSRTPLFMAVDEEGGQVSRVSSKDAMGVSHLPAPATYGESGDTQTVYDSGYMLGSQLRQLGFNLNFAPVADITTNPNNTEIGNRSYSSDPQVAAEMVDAMVRGLQDSGIAACLKHFPGHGSTEADSHAGVTVSTRTVDELRTAEWIPFSQGIDAGAAFVMVGHQTNENLSPFPTSLSPVAMAYLRSELGFDGLIVTDSLQMGAIIYYYTSAQAAVMAVQAGADLLLMPNDLQTAYDGLAAAIEEGTLTEKRIDESVMRILETKYRFGIIR